MRAPARGQPGHVGDTKLYLGAVSVRAAEGRAPSESRVYKVCNLSRRRYVKSFPAVGHWLSLVPVLPFLDLIVELFCCWVMPDTFGRYAVADYDESKSQEPQFPFRLGRAREGADTLQAFEALGRSRAVRQVHAVRQGRETTRMRRNRWNTSTSPPSASRPSSPPAA